MSEKLNPDELCPCGTDLIYQDCCWDKDFDWVINDEGECARVIPVNADVEEALDNARKVFIDIFGREPYKTDPMFPLKYFHNEDDLERETIKIMRESGMRPEIVYAYEKTGGLLVTEENWNMLPTKDQELWDEAIDEYFYLQDNPPEEDQFEAAGAAIIEDLRRMIIVFGYILEYGQSESYKGDYSHSKYISIDEYALTCAARSFKTLRAIKFLLDNSIGADSLALARSIYESYLHIAFIKAHPEKIESFFALQLGIKAGTHVYAKNKKGNVDRRTVIRIEDGACMDGHISMYKMASSSKEPLDTEIFDSLYEFLSEFSHAGLSYLTKTDSVDITRTELQFEAVFYTSTFSIFILEQLVDLSILTEEAKKDIEVITKSVSNNLLTFLREAHEENNDNPEIKLIKSRIQKIHERECNA